MNTEWESKLMQRLTHLEELLTSLLDRGATKDLYTTAEAAKILGRSEFTVREWCRHGRVNAVKRECGRGRSREWAISADEMARIQNEGLLPVAGIYRHG